ncbi:DNA polymerase III subunit gamma/tau [Brotaphodocola sp.]|uniref:DNA polymerase III subunit gamma/tau n=1 Tax=Brotaphodocola sp. TaxID=3073577 RepID=UPI003D7D9B92
MSYTALYRKWRPVRFDDVCGQDHIVQTLQNQIISQRIGHAYLFCGTRGTGKTSIAKIFSRAVNCEHPVNGSPCNECETCKSILSGSSMNVVEIDAASNNGVENIREIREQVQYPPTEGKYRVYIIDEVHMLSVGAFNALLKTLEEPPSYVIFILATTEVHKIPITVLSRCQRYDFKRITIDTIAGRLRELVDAEKIEVEEKALRYIAKAADGSMRDALSLLDQCVAFHYGTLLTYDNVLDVLGAVDTAVFSELLRAVIAKDTTACMKQLEEMVIQGRELGQFVIDFIWYLRNLLILKTTDDAESMLEMSEENLNQLREEAQMIEGETLMRYIRIFSELSGQLRYASQKRVLIEIALIKLTKPQMEQNLDSILQRLDELEERLDEAPVMSPDLMQQMSAQMTSQMGTQGAADLAGLPGSASVEAAGADSPAAFSMSGQGAALQASVPPAQVAIPKAQLEDLNLIRQEWGKIIRELGGAIRPSFRDTILEPSGDSCLCIVFSIRDNYEIGSRPTILGELEKHVKERYGKDIYFKTRLRDEGERLNTIYVSDEELKEAIHMEIQVED